MNYLPSALLLALTFVLVACSANDVDTTPDTAIFQTVNAAGPPGSLRETVLLVSLDDGSVIKQIIYSTADLCFKRNSVSSTICLTEGTAVIDPVTNAVLGFEMIEERIDLLAKID